MNEPSIELDEATATALVATLHNHIESLKAWQRKLSTPYLPKPGIYTPIYGKPTLQTTLHLMVEAQTLRLNVLNITNKFLDARKKEKA